MLYVIGAVSGWVAAILTISLCRNAYEAGLVGGYSFCLYPDNPVFAKAGKRLQRILPTIDVYSTQQPSRVTTPEDRLNHPEDMRNQMEAVPGETRTVSWCETCGQLIGRR